MSFKCTFKKFEKVWTKDPIIYFYLIKFQTFYLLPNGGKGKILFDCYTKVESINIDQYP